MSDLPVCVLDLETRSALDLTKTNAVIYALHPTTDVWLLRYAFTDDPDTIYRWAPGEPMPENLEWHLTLDGKISAHNAGFEYAIWTHILTPRYGWHPIRLDDLTDTAARAARCGLPRKLELAAPAMGLEQEKDTKGAQQMKRMAKPRKVHELDTSSGLDESITSIVEEYEQDPHTYTVTWDGDTAIVYEWWNVPDRVHRLGLYCDQDVRTQMAMELRLPELSEQERAIWLATMRANERGCQLDLDFIRSAMIMIEERIGRYCDELKQITHHVASSHNDLNGIKDWLAMQGLQVDSLDKNVVAAMLEDPELDEKIKRVVSIRAEAGKTSVGKYPAMLANADEHGVTYDLLVYYGAIATGRWAGRGIQVQNLPARGGIGYELAEWLIATTLQEGPKAAGELAEMLLPGSIIESLSMCLRGAIRARDGMNIVCADYSNIEGRFAAWLAGEAWKIQAFRDFDAGTGPDLYKVAAGGILGQAPEDVSKTMRNAVGKVSELALQFGGGVGAFVSMAKVYRVEIADYWADIRANLPERIIEEAFEAYDSFGKKSGIAKSTWIPAEAVKRAWREKHPAIASNDYERPGAWKQCENAAIAAIQNPGTAYWACDRRLGFFCKELFGKPFLLMRLPSGRSIYYANVRLRDKKTPWGASKPSIVFDKVEQGRIVRSHTYGGDLFQSAVQGGARDIMANGWLEVESADYAPLFSVHDEMVTEKEAGTEDLEEFERLLCSLPEWAEGLPVTAEGYVAQRFRKD